MNDRRTSVGALAGIRVIDLSHQAAGPWCTSLLGDLGADVIKIEKPGRGDSIRYADRTGRLPPEIGGLNFQGLNRNKRGITVDIGQDAGVALVRRLVRDADVLVENFRPGVMARLGLGDERLAELNPGLVRLSISGFGEAGANRDRVGYDQIVQAEGGLMSMTGMPGGPVVKVGVPIADVSAGLFGVIGVLGALVERGRTGRGQRVSTSLLAAQAGIHTFQATRYLVGGEVPGPSGNHHPTVAPYGLFEAADGPLVIAVGNEDIWWRFAPLVEVDPADPRFAANALRLRHLAELHQILATALAARPVAAWLTLLAGAGVPAGQVKALDEVYDGGQLAWTVDHPALGRIRLPASPLQFSRSTLGPGRPPPLLGEHTDEVRQAVTGDRQGDAR
jgi:crotonobetainyl-CoA:carnitine CoA-transferase CaiB-like acyl-CoA transferase